MFDVMIAPGLLAVVAMMWTGRGGLMAKENNSPKTPGVFASEGSRQTFPRVELYRRELAEIDYDPMSRLDATNFRKKLALAHATNLSETLGPHRESVALLQMLLEVRAPTEIMEIFVDRLARERAAEKKGGSR